MNRKLHRTTGRIVRRELRALVDGGVIRDARVRVTRIGTCCRCRISSHLKDGSPLMVEAIGATRARAVRLAVQRLRDRVRGRFESRYPFGKENNDEQHNMEGRATCHARELPRRWIGRRFQEVPGGWAILP